MKKLWVFLCALLPVVSIGAEVKRGLAAITVPKGFIVELVAGPDLAPYGMLADIDAKGRLFIAASSGKNIGGKAMSEKPECKILMLEDTNGDGRFDKSTVYAKNVGIPMGVLCWQGNVYTASPPDVLRLRDTDGDGEADQREVLASGWHVRGTASLHGPFLGPEGWLYLTDGRHGFDIKTKDGRKYKGLASRIWRMRPDGTKLESVAGGGFDNPVEIIFTPGGEMIGTMTYFTNPKNGQRDSLMHFLEGGVYRKWHASVSEFKHTGDLLGPLTRFARVAPAGLHRHSGLSFGENFRGNLFSAQFNPHRIQRHVLNRRGATFVSEDSDFLVSSDPDFHPTDVLEAPDGSLLVIDTGGWYIDQCPLSRISRPDHKGGVYRIRKKGAGEVKDPLGTFLDYSDLSLNAFANLLADDRPKVRARAMEAMVKMNETIVPPLAALIVNPKANHEAKCHAVWALHRQGSKQARIEIRKALAHEARTVRIAAARSTGLAKDQAAIQPVLAGLRSKDRAVSREMATALGFMGCNNATGPLAEAAARSTDAHHDHAIIHSLILLNVPELLQRKLQSKNPRVQRAALIALDQIDDSPLRSDDVSPLLDSADAELSRAALWVMTHHPDWTGGVAEYLDKKMLLDPDWTEAETATVREGLTVFAGSKAVQQLMVRWLDGRPLLTVANLEARRPFLLSVVAQCELKALPAAWTQTLSQVIGNSKRAEATRLAAIGVVQTRGLTSLDAPLRKLAGNPKVPPALRLAAMGVAAPRMKMVTADTTKFLQNQIGLKSTATARASAARVIGRLPWTPVQLQSLATETLPQADGFTLPLLLPAFANSQDAAVGLSLVNALTQAPQGVLRAAQVTQVLEKFPAVVHAAAKPLLAELARANAANEKRLEELVPLLSGGDVGRGREVYFGQKAVCSTCHTIGEDGGNLGPDLTSIGAIRSGRDILEAIVFPSATQVPGHEAFLVQGSSKALIGLVVRETATAITLRTAPGVELRLVRRDISSITPAPVSLMPAGLDRILARDEFRDLLAFLQSQNGEQWLQPSKLGKKDLRVRDSGIRE